MLTQAYASGTIKWTPEGGIEQVGDCDNTAHIHAAMCGLPKPGCEANASLGVGALAEGGSVQVSCPAGKVGVRVVTCEQEVQQVNDEGCRDIADLKDNTKKQAARQALKTAMPANAKATKQESYGGSTNKTTLTYKDARKTALKAAKNARRAEILSQSTKDTWTQFVVEDTDDFEGYSDAVLAKRQAKLDAKRAQNPSAEYRIRYRAAPADLPCSFTTPDLTLTKEEGMDVVDPETCVTIGVEGEPGVIKMTKNGELFDLECNDGPNQADMEIGSEFTCQGRVWDIGSVSTDVNDPVVTAPSTCPSNTTGMTAAEYINAQCCQCL